MDFQSRRSHEVVCLFVLVDLSVVERCAFADLTPSASCDWGPFVDKYLHGNGDHARRKHMRTHTL